MPTLLDKLWEAHLVRREPGRADLIYCDRHLVHEVTSAQAFAALARQGRPVRRPDLTFAVMDHVVPTEPGRSLPLADEVAGAQLAALAENCRRHGVRLWDMGHPSQGIVHVAAPELGLVLPGQTVFCGDSHTATHGAFGSLAFGIGTSEVHHVLATQTLVQAKPELLPVRLEGRPGPGVSAKDLILAVIAELGVAGGAGRAIEYHGPAVEGLSMEGRMTLCNMSIECGAKAGMVAPDSATLDWLAGRPFAPAGEDWERAAEWWLGLASDPESRGPDGLVLDAGELEPMATWGTNPGQAAPVGGAVPEPGSYAEPGRRAAAERALEYMGLEPGQPLGDIKIDCVFIGSCTGGRLEDLRAAAAVLAGRRLAPGVRGLVVPGSGLVKRQAEAEGLHRVFAEAGMEWREPGCSLCLAMNPDVLAPGEACASTSNRNFEDRQGRGGRTHLVSPATAAAAGVAGRLVDAREMLG